MICVCNLPSGLDIGGFILKGAMIGHEDHQLARAPGRERIAGYEITRNVPEDVYVRWFAGNKNGPIIQNGLVCGFADDQQLEMEAWCYAHRTVRGWMKAAQE